LRATRLRGSPLLALLGGLVVWCMITVAIKVPAKVGDNLGKFAISLIVFIVLSEGLPTLKSLGTVGRVLFAFTVGLAALGVHQGLSQKICFQAGSGPVYDATKDFSDGRTCDTRQDCYEGGDPNVSVYACEHPGLFSTHSIGGRVRYRGILEDPNELSWALSMGLPLAFALYELRRTRMRLFGLIAGIILSGVCTIMTQSRSGQLGMMATLGIYFVRRFRGRGLLVAGLAGLPLMLFGGRSGAAAEASTEERLMCWSEAFNMWRENPLAGVGAGQFLDNYYTTAHNSPLLAAAELGFPGLVIWTAAVYFAFKITIRAQKELGARPEAQAARVWAMALLASLVGMTTSSIFLTLTYHTVLWIYLGLAGALYAVIRTHDPEFRVRFGWRDLVLVTLGDIAYLIGIAVYLRIKGF
jgi:hypothetical protein